MKIIFPPKLKKGDEIRIVAPSRGLSIISKESIALAERRLNDLGLKVTYGKNVMEKNYDNSSSVKSRVDDIHDAFRDKNVKAILTVVGGYNTNQILSYLDYNLIKSNPKILCGYSDIAALQNAIFAKTGLVCYSGPHFSTFGMEKGFDYINESFKKAVFNEEPYSILPSKEWSDDLWFLDQKNRNFISNEGPFVINRGTAKGNIVGSNLCTFNLLQGTEFMPELKDSILFIEDDSESKPGNFDRDLQSLIHQPGFNEVRGILIGRFQTQSEMTKGIIKEILSSKKELKNIPIICDVDFGHTYPFATFPIGGYAEIYANDKIKILIMKH